MSSDFDILYQIQKLLMSKFQVYQFQIKFVMLCHAAKCNMGTNKSSSSKEAVGSGKNCATGNYCERMASNEIGNNKSHA